MTLYTVSEFLVHDVDNQQLGYNGLPLNLYYQEQGCLQPHPYWLSSAATPQFHRIRKSYLILV